MKQIIKRTALPVLGLASLGAFTQAQADTEPYPAQLQSLIDEAKSLGIQVVECLIRTIAPQQTCKPITTILLSNYKVW